MQYYLRKNLHLSATASAVGSNSAKNMSHRLRELVSILAPIPFLLGMAMIVSAFWQSDADFVVGKVKVFDAVLVDQGQASETRGKPHYFPTFKLSDGQILTLERPTLASKIPQGEQPVQLRCSTQQPRNCKIGADSNDDLVFYGIVLAWSLFALGITWAMWGTRVRKALRG